jgi:hypothetical protein
MLSLLRITDDPVLIRFIADTRGDPLAHQKRIAELHRHWATGFKWLLREEFRLAPDDFNARRKLEQAFKPFGLWLKGLYRVCKEVYFDNSQGYPAGVAMFEAVCKELWREDCAQCIFGHPSGAGKWVLIKESRYQIKQMRSYENPFDRQKQPHYWGLIDAGIALALKNPGFDKEYWRPWLRLKASQGKAVEGSEWSAWTVADGKLKQGNNRTKVSDLWKAHQIRVSAPNLLCDHSSYLVYDFI